MKKILLGMTLLSTIAMGAEGTNLYLRAGADINGKFDVIVDNDFIANKKKADKIGHEIAVEVTKEVLPNFELGLGVAYQNHGKAEKNIYNISAGQNITNYYEMPEMKSIPLYVTTKYNLPINTMVKPYLKADLGYSFNKIDGKLGIIDIRGGKRLNIPSYETEIKDGTYFGIGGGFEYNDFTMDLMYKINKAELEYGEKDSKKREKKDLDYSRITLSVGYKFNF